jgi:hypothetical protein
MKNNPYDLDLDLLLKENKFKMKWFDDRSGYWWEKKYELADIKYKVIVETDSKRVFTNIQCQDEYGKISYETFRTFNKITYEFLQRKLSAKVVHGFLLNNPIKKNKK